MATARSAVAKYLNTIQSISSDREVFLDSSKLKQARVKDKEIRLAELQRERAALLREIAILKQALAGHQNF
jgi:hypothetical protein